MPCVELISANKEAMKRHFRDYLGNLHGTIFRELLLILKGDGVIMVMCFFLRLHLLEIHTDVFTGE